ncbi:integrase [Burkholderia ubonensis]|nr:integrase [Burkholderia ubonensis]ODQ25884.1 integrase [Burkholderia ubonensis]OJA28444.1 integrase [Burkholderia ubonensis]OJB66584.1 integrase [Burkholderia ubonensis]
MERIRVRKKGYKVVSTALVVNETGGRLMADALRFRFDRARELAGVPKDSFQFRDLRAKAGTDKTESEGDIRAAQRQLGHKSIAMTEHYVRERKGIGLIQPSEGGKYAHEFDGAAGGVARSVSIG